MSSFRKLTDFWKRVPQETLPRSLTGQETANTGHPPGIKTFNEDPEAVASAGAGPSSSQAFRPYDGQQIDGEQTPRTRSRRIVRNGKVIIKSSDNEDSDSDSDELDDLDDLFARHGQNGTGSTSEETTNIQLATTNTVSTQSLRSRERMAGSTKRDPPKYKFSLSNLVFQKEKDVAADIELAKARAALTSDKDISSERGIRRAGRREDVDKDLLSNLINPGDGGSTIQKVIDAMRRTEALDWKKTWSFFESDLHVTPHDTSFPGDEDSLGEWRPLLKDPKSREQTFRSGLMVELLPWASLPTEVLDWILDEICLETNDILRHAYQLVFLHSRSRQIKDILRPERIKQMFKLLGARIEALDLEKVAIASNRGEHGSLARTDDIKAIIQFLSSITSNLSLESKEFVLAILCRLSLDETVATNPAIRNTIDTAFGSLIESFHEHEAKQSLSRVIQTVNSFTEDDRLRAQILDCIPTCSKQLHWLRRSLALTMLFGTNWSELNGLDASLIQAFTKLLDNSSFSISKTTNYGDLAALSAILDIAIDDGQFSDDIQQSDADELTFNADVDSLARRIQTIFTSIVDTGASHMTRTEAKEVLERVHYRLIYGIRTKGKPKENIFGATMGNIKFGHAAQTNRIDRYLPEQR